MHHQRAVWQIAAGNAARDYTGEFLTSGVALIGPGDAGPWAPGQADAKSEGGWVRRFASDLTEGDILLLRSGIRTVVAIGIVASGYQYLPQFGDVNGWDLQHARRVRWYRFPKAYQFSSAVFGANPQRLSRVAHQDVLDFAIRNISGPPDDWKTGTLPALPLEESALADIPPELRDGIARIQDLGRCYQDREALGKPPSEFEIVAHCIVPFLEALGWNRFQIAVEWNNIDVAVFSKLPRVPENCRFVVEAKAFNEGIESARAQAKNYHDRLGICCDLVVTDGFRYKMYAATDVTRPIAYANLWEPRQSALALFDKMKRQSYA